MNYCETCNKRVPTRIGKHEEELPVRGEPTRIVAEVRVCEVCGSVCYDEELDSASMSAAFDIYRRKHNIIFPDEIRTTREKYGLSQRGLAALLGWGEATIHRYESGSIADESHNLMLRMIEDPVNMKRIFNQYRDRLPPSKQRRLDARLNELLGGVGKSARAVSACFQAQRYEAGPLTGFRRFSGDALQAMMVFFAQGQGVLKTKLNKLLWYSDFLHCRLHTVSISGAAYIHLDFGPVPDDYEIYLGSLIADGALEPIEVEFTSEIVGELLKATEPPDMGALPETAEPVLMAVNEFFQTIGGKAISDLSHREAAYTETKPGMPISYEYATKLMIDIPL